MFVNIALKPFNNWNMKHEKYEKNGIYNVYLIR